MRWFKTIFWYFFDMGNSAHALLISTVGFSLYFKSYLYQGSPEGDSWWAILTALILFCSAVLSPIITSFLSNSSNRYYGLMSMTLLSVIATLLLGTHLGDNKAYAITLYILSALGYYLALPIYNSYLPQITANRLQRISGIGWALGYLGGILAVSICLVLGFLDHDVTDRPDIYRQIFVVAGLFNLVLSTPLMIISQRLEQTTVSEGKHKWSLTMILEIFAKYRRYQILRLFVVYWLVGEIAVIVTYFFAIFLKDYAGLETKQIMVFAILGQIFAIITTWTAGIVSEKLGSKRVLLFIIALWICIPIVLFLTSMGLTYWIAIILISVVIGSYHSIIRGRIAFISNQLEESSEKGSLFGFLEVSGRISQVVGPIFVALLTISLPLNYAILFASVFPIIAFFLLRRVSMEDVA